MTASTNRFALAHIAAQSTIMNEWQVFPNVFATSISNPSNVSNEVDQGRGEHSVLA